jgi:transmembrane 9 superfamily protein 3
MELLLIYCLPCRYVAGGYHSRNDGANWIKCMVMTATLFPGMCFAIAFSLNTIAIFYHSLAAVPFGTMVVVFVIWAFVSSPFVLFGTVRIYYTARYTALGL